MILTRYLRKEQSEIAGHEVGKIREKESNMSRKLKAHKKLLTYEGLQCIALALHAKGTSQQDINVMLGRGNSTGLSGVFSRFVNKYTTVDDRLITPKGPELATKAVRKFMAHQVTELPQPKPKVALANKVFLSMADLGKYLGVSAKMVRDWSSEGVLPTPRKIGSKMLWHKHDIEAWAAKIGQQDQPGGLGGDGNDLDTKPIVDKTPLSPAYTPNPGPTSSMAPGPRMVPRYDRNEPAE